MKILRTRSDTVFFVTDAPKLKTSSGLLTPMKVTLTSFAGEQEKNERTFVLVTGPSFNMEMRGAKFCVYGNMKAPRISEAPDWLKELVGHE